MNTTTVDPSLAAADKTGLRDEMLEGVVRLVLGPMSHDEKLASNPSDTYLTGILWPRGEENSVADDDGGTLDVGGGDDLSEAAVPGYRSRKPCSIGMTFSVSKGATVKIDVGSTAIYVPVIEVQEHDAPPAAASVRSDPPARRRGAQSTTEPTATQAAEQTAQKDRDSNYVRYLWQRVPMAVNLSIEPDERRDQWREEVRVGQGSAVQAVIDIKRRLAGQEAVFTVTLINLSPEAPRGVPNDTTLLFQAQVRAHAAEADGSPGIKPRKAVTALDDEDGTNDLIYRDVREFAVGHGIAAEWEASDGSVIRVVETSWMPRGQVKGTTPKGHALLDEIRERKGSVLEAARLSNSDDRGAICVELKEFCALYESWIAKELKARANQFQGSFQGTAHSIIARCENAAGRMNGGVNCLENNPRAWSAFCLANRAMDRQSRFPAKGTRAGPLVWRPFQLAFILLSLRSIAVPEDPDRMTMDLLWFPTGGGKTEAYLALTAYQIFLRRLEIGARREAAGVDVLMRYTLRLLTIQQFQRAASLITACDFIRRENEGTLGIAPILLGLYVGGDSTPNDLEGAAEKLQQERDGQRPRSTPRQLLKCPVCGGDLLTTAYRVDLPARTMTIRCVAEGCETGGSPLPVMTVDEQLFAVPPSLLIGTVDKFAQLPRSMKIRAIFGLDSGVPPGLIIQDELHLISGPLGSMTGLYEAAIDYLCMAKAGTRPKVVGSTATIGRASRQVRALFDRGVMQFPPSGFEPGNSFFAVTDETGPDRMYLGLSSAGRSPKFTLQAVVAAALQMAARLRERQATDANIDPYWTCVAYFNSLRELGGAHVMMMDDVPRQMTFLASRVGGARRKLEEPPKELSSRVASSLIPETLIALEKGLGGGIYDALPADTVLASNMISVGVDVPRLGLMVVNGQPKSTAEYIQATSRVGRGIPGLVIVSYNFGRPRDLSHFEHFKTYHAALYRGVEATSVTPWAPRARDKALHAVFIAAARHGISGLVDDEAAMQFRRDNPMVPKILDFLVARAKEGSKSMLGEDTESQETRADLEAIVEYWAGLAADARNAGQRLRYWIKPAPFGRTAPHLMRAAEENRASDSRSWPTPNSLREVEPSTPFVLKRIRRNEGGPDGGAAQ
jgi:hypothetical protein